MSKHAKGLVSQYEDIFLVDGVRTPFADYNTVLGLVSPIDLGIKVAREVFKRSGVSPQDVVAVQSLSDGPLSDNLPVNVVR